MKYREWTRRETKHLGELELEDFLLDECILELKDETGQALDVDDVPSPDLAIVVKTLFDGLSPNGRRGSRR